MGIYRIKPAFQRFLQPITNLLVKNKVSPDWLTGGAIVVAGVMAFALIQSTENLLWLWLVVIGAFVRTALNALDGQVARALGDAGDWGEVKNELGDRLADMIIFAALIFLPTIPQILSIVAFCTAFLSGYVGMLSKAITGVRDYSGIMGKPDRMAAIAVGSGLVALTGWWNWLWIALGVVILLGIWTIGLRLKATYDRCG